MISSDALTLLFKAAADTDDAKKSFADLRSEVKATSDTAGETSNWQTLGRSIGMTDSQLSTLGKNLPLIGSAFAALGAAITATAAAGVAATQKLFELSKSAADFGSEIFDASEKTGLAAETLSAMKFAAEQSGTSLETITASSAKFAKLIGEAANGSEKAQAALKRLGVTSYDLDTALGQALKTIVEMEPGTEQMTAAMTAFGRSGADLLPFIKSFDGDLAELVKTAKDLGVTISDESAAAADEFGDALDTLNAQLAAVGHTIGFAVMPEFLKLVNELSTWLAQNKAAISEWGGTIRQVLSDAVAAFRHLFNFIRENAATIRANLAAITGGLSEALYLGAQYYLASAGRRGNATAGAFAGGRVSLPGGDGVPSGIRAAGGGTRRKPPAETDDEFRRFFTEQGFTVSRTFGNAINKNSLHPSGMAADVSIRGKRIEEIFELTVKALEKGYRLFDERLKQPGVKQTGPHLHYERNGGSKASTFLDPSFYGGQEQLDYLKKLDAERLGKTTAGKFDKYVEDTEKKAEDAAKKEEAIRLKSERDTLDKLRRMQHNEAEIARQFLENEVANRRATEMDAAQALHAMRLDMLEKERQELERHTDTQERNDELLLNEIELEKEKLRFAREYGDQLEKQNQLEQESLDRLKERMALVSSQSGPKPGYDANGNPINIPGDPGPEGGSFLSGMIDGLGTSIEDMTKKIDPLKTVGNIIGSQFNMIAQAVGSAVKAFVLFGSAGGSFKKFAAEMLASIAQMAIVQAVWELAQGFAMLALSWFTGNPKYGAAAGAHFAAAAIYGAVGGVAMIAGRAVAGDSFKNEAAGGYGTAGSGSQSPNNQNTQQQGQAYSSNEEVIVEGDRNRPLMQENRVSITFAERSGGFADWFDVQVRQNGKLRQTLLDATS